MGNKKVKKILCHGLVIVMAITSVFTGTANITLSETMLQVKAAEDEKTVFYKNGFEDGQYQGIMERGATIEVSTSVHHDVGNNSLSVKGRTATWHGIQLPLAKYVISGNRYDFKVYVKQDSGSTQTIDLGIQYKGVDGNTQYPSVDSSDCASGEWTELSGSFTVPETANEIALFMQCSSSDTAEFFIDDLTISGIPQEIKEFKPDEETYNTMVKGGVYSTGNNARIKAALQKARDGEDVSLAYIGGSITEGGGYNPNSACYAEVSATAFAKKYGVDGGENVHFINAGMSGTSSDIGIIRYRRDVIGRLPEGSSHPDILFIEFAVNDNGTETGGGAYEGLIRQALKSGSAVVLVFSVFSVLDKGELVGINRVKEMDYRKYGTAYDLPMISTADAIKDVYGADGFYDWFYNDSLHPNANGYKLMADCILELMARIDKEEVKTDNITDVDSIKAVTSSSFEEIKMIDSATTADSDPAISAINKGGFSSIDSAVPTYQYLYNGKPGKKWFPNNWMHDENGTNDPLKIEVNCRTFMLLYKETSESAYGSADLYVDGKKKSTLSCHNASGWNNGKVCIALQEAKSAKHKIELKMAAGDEGKKFTLYAIGYQTGDAQETLDNGCLKVLNRTSVDGGAAFNLNNQLSTDKTYTVSAKVMYIGGAAERTINITIEAGPDWEYRKGIANAKVQKGKWTEIKSTTYKPGKSDRQKDFDATNVKLFFETPYGSGDLDDFYIDDVVVTENDGDSILNVSFDSDADIDAAGATVKKVSAFSNAQIQWVKESEETPPDPSEIVPLQVNGDAETGDTTGWKVNSGGGENATLTATKEDKYAGEYSIKVTNRVNCASGPMQNLNGKLVAGKKYKVTGRVKYTAGPSNRAFEICYQHGDTWEERTTFKQISVKRGKWSQLYGTFTAKGTGTDQIFVATSWVKEPTKENDLMDFYVDDIVISLDDGEVPDPDPQEHECIEGSTLVSGALKAENNNTHVNPLFDYKFGADPYAITYNGRVYVYTTNDSQEYETVKDKYGYPTKGNGFGNINTLNVFSSADMVNWTDHGEVSVAGKGAAKLSWAPAVGHKEINGKEKFFLYFANGGSGIYVLESDSPIGPFEAPKTARGSALITPEDDQGKGIPYLFDPAVLVDDDGSAYLYYGGGFPDGSSQEVINNPKTFRVVKLKDNMVEVDGDAKVIEAPGNFEDSGIHKYNGKYYFTYCSNFANNLPQTGTGNICAMVSDKPMEGFEFAGIVFPNQGSFFGAGTGGNNHHCFFDFNGKHYLTYHAQTLAVELGFSGNDQSGYRSTHIDEFEYGEDGKINVVGTWAGSAQVKDLNPYERVEAETIAWSKGIKADTCKEEGSLVKRLNMMVTEITGGDYLAVSSADFGTGSGRFIMHVAGLAGGTVELHLDGTAGQKVGEVQVPKGDGKTWTDVSCITDISGKHSLYLVFKGGEGQLMYADYWKFNKPLTSEQKSQVDSVIDLINKIGTVSNNQTSKAAIDAARKAYNGLTAEQKEYVTNAGTLTAAEKTYQEIKDNLSETEKPTVNETFVSTDGQKFKVTSFSGSSKCVTVTGTGKQLADLTVPDTITYKGETFTVTEIADSAFANQNLKSVVIGKNVTKIGKKAFYNCKNLAKVTFKGTAVKTIGKDAFKGIKKNASFTMTKNTFTSKSLKYKVTKCTTSVKEVTVTGASKKTLASLSIPATVKYNGMTFKVTAVNKKAFKNQKKLKNVTVGKNIKSIGASAFEGSKKLAKIKFSGTVLKSIGKNAFKNIKKNAVFTVKKSKKASYKKLLTKAKTKNFKVK